MQPRLAGPIRRAVISTRDVDKAAAAYVDYLEFVEVERGIVKAGDAILEVASAILGRRWISLQARNRELGGILFIETKSEAPATFQTLGWAAIEIVVENVDDLVERCRNSPFEILIEPTLVGSGASLRAAQLRGPSGEGIYFTEILKELGSFELPQESQGVAGIFIAVLAASDLEESRGILESYLVARRVTDHSLPVKILNKSFDLPLDNLHRISSIQLLGECVIETDQYPEAAFDRECLTHDLPTGVAIVTLHGPELSRSEFIRLPGDAILEISPS
jgi:hypothetical protein